MSKKIRLLVIGSLIILLIFPIYISVAASLLGSTYLPMIYKAPPATPTYTPTPTSIPTPELIPNGDFEQGALVWTQYSQNEWPLIVQEFPVDVYPFDGTWAAWLGGSNDELALIQQQVVVPPHIPYLSYRFWITSSDQCNSDFGYFFLNGTQLETYDLCYTTSGWAQNVLDLRAYAGTSVTIQFFVECNAQWVSSLFIDHVNFQASIVGANHTAQEKTNIVP